MKNLKVLSVLAVVSITIYCIIIEFRWRYYNDNALKVEVSKDLDLDKVVIIWDHYMGNDTIFERGEQINNISEVPMAWNIVYSDTLGNTFHPHAGDKRRDFLYKFKFFRKKKAVFCEFTMYKKYDIFNNHRRETLHLGNF